MYQLSQNEDKQEKLFDELKRALSAKDARITPETLEQLPYLKACIKETLRMYPVVLGNGRSLQSDAVICGYNVPKGVMLLKLFHNFIDRKFNFQFFSISTDSCDFPALRSLQQGKLLPGTDEIHSRAVAEERRSITERHPPIRESPVWLWSTYVHRSSLCRCRISHSAVKSNFLRFNTVTIQLFTKIFSIDFPQISRQIQLRSDELSC